MAGVRHRITIIGPGAVGFLRASYQTPAGEGVIDVLPDRLPPQLRLPNATFVGLVRGRDLIRVEPDGEAWLTIQDAIRVVVNRDWDPIGVSAVVANEYDGYIDELYRLLKAGASEEELARRLGSIEAVEMQYPTSSVSKLRNVAEALRELKLPDTESSTA